MRVAVEGTERSVLMAAEDAQRASDDVWLYGNVFARATNHEVPNEAGEPETVYERIDPATVRARR